MKKRIKLKETQLNMVKSIVENDPEFRMDVTPEVFKSMYEKLKKHHDKALSDMDKYYNIIMSYTLHDIIKNDGVKKKIKAISDEIDSLNSFAENTARDFEDKITHLPEEEYDAWGDRLHSKLDASGLAHSIYDKYNALDNLINEIDSFIMSYGDEEIDNHFSNIEPDIEI